MVTQDSLTSNSSEIKQKHSTDTDEAIAKKWQIATGMLIDEGTPNLVSSLHILYDSLYHPGAVIETYAIPESKEFPSRNDELSADIVAMSAHQPEFDEFVAAMREQLLQPELLRGAMYPGARSLVQNMVQQGPTMIWTEGDMYGYGPGVHQQPQKTESMLLPERVDGSKVQMAKLRGMGVPEAYKELFEQGILSRKLGERASREDAIALPRFNTLQYNISEDKFSETTISRMADFFQSRGITEAVVIEDRIKNIDRLQVAMAEYGIAIRGVLVVQGRHAEGIDREQVAAQRGYPVNVATSTADVVQVLETIGESEQGYICDVDGVLSNQAQLMKAQKQILVRVLKENGWV